MPTASLMGANAVRKSLAKWAWCLSPVKSTDCDGFVVLANPNGPYTWGIKQTSLLFDVPFRGHVCPEALPAIRSIRTQNPTIAYRLITLLLRLDGPRSSDLVEPLPNSHAWPVVQCGRVHVSPV